jgi:hypothetical protein
MFRLDTNEQIRELPGNGIVFIPFSNNRHQLAAWVFMCGLALNILVFRLSCLKFWAWSENLRWLGKALFFMWSWSNVKKRTSVFDEPLIKWVGSQSGNSSDLCFDSTWIKSLPGHLLCKLSFFFLWFSADPLGKYWDFTLNYDDLFPSTSLCTSNSTIWFHIVWAAGDMVK